ncbi:MAG: UDP-N-acetylmuramate dehydrogenase [Gemmataceae bacterium]
MTDVLPHWHDFAEITRAKEPLAPFTQLKIGGPAEALVEPRTAAELQAVLRRCAEQHLPWRVLGGGGNLLIRDEGVKGVVLRLSAPAFSGVEVRGRRIRAGAGASLASLISHAGRHGLSGLEQFVGLPGTVGGALRNFAGDRFGDLGQRVVQVEGVDYQGQAVVLQREELGISAGLDEVVVVAAEFELDPDSPEGIVKRMRKAWIHRKASQPFTFQSAVRMFKNPPGLSATALIEQAGLVGTRVGGAVVSDRDASYVVVEAGAGSRDVLRLLDLVRSRVEEKFNIELESDITVW